MTIWLDERIRFDNWPQVSVYNMPSVFQIDSGYLSIDKCYEALRQIVAHQWIFRTRLVFDFECGCLNQVIDENQCICPIRVSTYTDDTQKIALLSEELNKPFNTEQDGFFRCHLIRQHHDHSDDNVLTVGDLIIFHFHHGSFDGRAADLFLDEFKRAYAGTQLQSPSLQYIDYSIHERALPMIEAKNYWQTVLQNYDVNRQLYLGTMSTNLSVLHRTGKGSSLNIIIPSKIAHSMITFTRQFNVTLFQLGLACYYLFLVELSSQNADACIGVIHLNRYRPELTSMIGMFANILPCRISIDSLQTLCFVELVYKIQKIFLENVEHAHFPYYQLLNLHQMPRSHLQFPFIQTVFRVDTSTVDYNNANSLVLDSSCRLSTYKLHQPNDIYKFDLELSFNYNQVSDTIECEWNYALDFFEMKTIEMHANRFIDLLTQLFDSHSPEKLQMPLDKIMSIDKEQKSTIVKCINHQVRNLF